MAARSAGRSRGIFKGFRRRLAPDAARSAKRASLYSSRSQLSLPIIAAKRPFVKKNRHFPGLRFRKTWRSSFLEAALPPRLPPKRMVRPSLCRRRLQPGDRAGLSGKSQPWPRGSPGLCFLQCGKRPEGLLFSASPGFPRAACAPSVRLSTLFAWWSPPHHGLLGSGFRRRAHGAKKAAPLEIVEKPGG